MFYEVLNEKRAAARSGISFGAYEKARTVPPTPAQKQRALGMFKRDLASKKQIKLAALEKTAIIGRLKNVPAGGALDALKDKGNPMLKQLGEAFNELGKKVRQLDADFNAGKIKGTQVRNSKGELKTLTAEEVYQNMRNRMLGRQAQYKKRAQGIQKTLKGEDRQMVLLPGAGQVGSPLPGVKNHDPNLFAEMGARQRALDATSKSSGVFTQKIQQRHKVIENALEEGGVNLTQDQKENLVTSIANTGGKYIDIKNAIKKGDFSVDAATGNIAIGGRTPRQFQLNTRQQGLSTVASSVPKSAHSASKPAASVPKSAPSASKPAASAPKSAPSASKPAPSAPRPAPSAPSPAPSASKSAPSAPSPAPSASKPAPSAPASASSPAPSAPKSAPSAPSPAPSASKPAASAPRPAPSAPSPAPSASSSEKGMSAGTMAALGIGVPAVAYGGYRALRPSKDQRKQEKKTAAFVQMLR